MPKKKLRHNPAPSLHVEGVQGGSTTIWALKKGDTVSMNSSGNYDHKSVGPGIFMEMDNVHSMEWYEGHTDDERMWKWLNEMVNLGQRWIRENPDADIWEIRSEISEAHAKLPRRNERREPDTHPCTGDKAWDGN